MGTGIRLERVNNAYRLRLRHRQALAMSAVLAVLRDLEVPDAALWVLAGCGRGELAGLAERIQTMDVTLSPAELHVLYNALVVGPAQFDREEPFHREVGFFTEHMAELAEGLIRAAATT